MKTLAQACHPRKTVFDRARRDVVLDITDLIEGDIKADEFFEENFVTDGMRRLLIEAFRRFKGDSDQGVFKLTQAMGGGKTHNMVALGLLAKYPKIREKVLPDLALVKKLGEVRVIGFTGRETDAPLGVWGALAEQLGKKQLFKDHYTPLKAPGPTAWVNLLEGEPLLIVLDELPPYFEHAKSVTIGNSDLAQVTTSALANLLIAVGKKELSNVCVVISDLRANYEGGSQLINQALKEMEDEVHRSALNLEPVGMNTDELYHILRKRIFDKLPDEKDIVEISRAYADAVKAAKQMDITSASPEETARQIRESYPFHPGIRDLYARFRENPGFQQTRGLIRLMRTVVARMYDPKKGTANNRHLIAAHDIDLNDRDTLSEITTINPTLENAIAKDIASDGNAMAEQFDKNRSGTDVQDVLKLLLISSLANVPAALKGLTRSEIISYLCSPSRDVSRIPNEVLEVVPTKAWYLHPRGDGGLFFKNVQNLVAKLTTVAQSYNRESSLKELRQRLGAMFEPTLKDCYQEVYALPARDDLEIRQDKVALVLYQPHTTDQLHPELKAFWDQLDYKNRVMFLTGTRGDLEKLLEAAAELKAINYILTEMDSERVPDNDPQRKNANDLLDKIQLRLLSAAKETFVVLHYPSTQGALQKAEFTMNYKDNEYRGENQIRDLLSAKQKFTTDVTGDTFRKKCELRLFGKTGNEPKTLPWSEVKKRAATTAAWPWHRSDGLESLKGKLILEDQWREDAGGFVDIGPFAQPKTEVRVQPISRDANTGAAKLRLTPVNGDIIHYEIGQPATTASAKVPNPQLFETNEMAVHFLCVDSKGQHETGNSMAWRNQITLKYKTWQNGNDLMVEIQAAPQASIRYTTDGSNPKVAGATYAGAFIVPKGTVCVLAVAEKNAVVSEPLRIDIDWEKENEVTIDPTKPVAWKREHYPKVTKDSYEFLGRVRKFKATASIERLTLAFNQRFLELSFDAQFKFTGEETEKVLEDLRRLLPEGQVSIESPTLHFERGQDLLDWVNEAQTTLQPGEVQQT
ncbi:MAG: DUF499 domain-containing protein [Verrucomicrobia bacterium]|nr:DUF499 domain-containing protein [Verrucomicrobiota bacterium]